MELLFELSERASWQKRWFLHSSPSFEEFDISWFSSLLCVHASHCSLDCGPYYEKYHSEKSRFPQSFLLLYCLVGLNARRQHVRFHLVWCQVHKLSWFLYQTQPRKANCASRIIDTCNKLLVIPQTPLTSSLEDCSNHHAHGIMTLLQPDDSQPLQVSL